MNAWDLFVNRGYNCAESALGGIVGEIDACSSLASGFGGGIGGSGDICGAATGAIMGLGARANVRVHDDRSVSELKDMVIRFLIAFEKECGGLDCRDLIPLDEMFDDEVSRKEYFSGRDRKTKCAAFVESAERIAESLLEEKGW